MTTEVETLRQAVRARQRAFGFANLEAVEFENGPFSGVHHECFFNWETKRAAELLADAEAKLHHEAKSNERFSNSKRV